MLYELRNRLLSVRVDTLGAELYSIRGNDGTEYLWQGSPDYWEGRATNIFPNCGRFFGGSYTYRGREYSLPCHGLAREAEFTPVEDACDASALCFELVSSDATREHYPFDFRLRISYRLDGARLACRLCVENIGDDILPFALGAHPGFNLPLGGSARFEDYRLDFGRLDRLSRINITPDGFVGEGTTPYPLKDGRFIELEHSLFDNDAMFFEGVPSTVRLISERDSHSVTLCCPQARYLGLWHTNGSDAPFICIEPWLGLPSPQGVVEDLADKADLVRLSSGDSFSFDYTVSFN